MISKSATSRASDPVSPVISRSADIVPMICPRCSSGTHTNDSASLIVRLCVRFRNRRSLRTSHTTSERPVFATSPVMPSPM